MEQIFMTELSIPRVRHLRNISIPLSAEGRKHLILTGKNGSGKTSVLEAFSRHLEYLTSDSFALKDEIETSISLFESELDKLSQSENRFSKKESYQKTLSAKKKQLETWTEGAYGHYTSISSLREKYGSGQYILAYYGDKRNLEVAISSNIEKIELQSIYALNAHPGKDFVKYLVNQKTRQAFAQTENQLNLAVEIKAWFERFQGILRDLYDEDALTLEFDTRTFEFKIRLPGREPFDFNSMSLGYSAVFDIICDLIMRMEAQGNYNLEGIVLIDEIEAHLHVELQRKIMPVLIKLFPNIQFVLTTHSPFILNSIDYAVVYDLEHQTLVEDGLSNYTYSGIIEGYFKSDNLSNDLRRKFDRYRELVSQPILSDEEYAEISELETYLDEIPDYLALDFMADYARMKLEFYKGGEGAE